MYITLNQSFGRKEVYVVAPQLIVPLRDCNLLVGVNSDVSRKHRTL